jgi:hypothetical protein
MTTVSHGLYAMFFLCKNCYDFRVPSAPLSDNGSASASQINVDTSLTGVRCELLCFLQNKCRVMSADHLNKLCADFYSKDEVIAARSMIEQRVSHRLPRRKGVDSSRASIEDMFKLCANPNNKLPSFYAMDLDRLPPVDATHCDVSAILKQIQALSSEVRRSADLHGEVDNLKAMIVKQRDEFCDVLQELKTLRGDMCVAGNVREELTLLKDVITKQTAGIPNALPAMSSSASTMNEPAKSTSMTYAKTVKTSVASEVQLNKKTRRTVAICGKGPCSSTSLVADGVRRADLFISRLRSDTTPDNIINLVKGSFP